MQGEPRKVLVMELAGLGDNVHLLPALWLVRNRWPSAELHVMVNAPSAALFKLTPWVDRVWAYPTAPRPRLRENLAWAGQLRRERFDCLVNTNGSDRSSLLSRATGARARISRRPADGGPPGWSLLFTQVLEQPYYQELMLAQKWRMLEQAGFTTAGEPEFHVTIDPEWRRAAGITADDEGTYFHVSPFTTMDRKELPAAQLAEVIDGLRTAHPRLRMVLTCAGNARERAKMDALLPQLREAPWQVHAGTLDVAGLAAVIEKSALSLSGDSAALHLAMMAGAPAVAWYRAHGGQKEWIPQDRKYRVVVAESDAPDALHGVATADILAAAATVLGVER